MTILPLHLVTNGLVSNDVAFPLIPSYTITLSSLLRARSSLETRGALKLLAVSCEGVQGFAKIPGAQKEVQDLADGIAAIHDSTILHGSEATVQQVLSAMSDHTWLHLACHGIQSSDEPYRSHFVLKDGPLYLRDIASAQLQKPEFAFLSACHTATGIPVLCDEAMHLAAGLHFAGYCGTIATMWGVHDKIAKRLAKLVYAFLFRGANGHPVVEDAAEALWKAIEALRAQGVPLSRLAPFIHMGV